MDKEVFYSSKRSITRARKHIHDLESGIAKFNAAGDAYEIITEQYEHGNKYVVKARLIQSIPADLESIAVDAVYNIRSSLDQAVFFLAKSAKKRGGTGIDLTKIHWKFPIAKSEDRVRNDIDKIIAPAGIPNELKDKILKFEPYYDSTNDQSLLFALSQLANINKHRYLTSTGIRTGAFSLTRVSGPSTVGPPSLKHINIGGEGNTITTVEASAPVDRDEIGLYCGLTANPTKYDVNATITLKFVDIVGLLDRGCIWQLNTLADTCDKVVEEFSILLGS